MAGTPCVVAEHGQGLRVDHRDAAEVDQRADRSDEVAQRVEVGRIRDRAAQHHARARPCGAFEQARVFLPQQLAERAGERIAVPFRQLAVDVAHDIDRDRDLYGDTSRTTGIAGGMEGDRANAETVAGRETAPRVRTY